MRRDGAGWWTERNALVLIMLAALVAVLPLAVHGCSCGHDFDFHLGSWMEAASQFRHGNLHPHWAFSPAFNAGEPRFVFYPPLSWTIGAVLGLLLTHLPGISRAAGWNAVPIVYTWIALSLSGVMLYRLSRRYASEGSAAIAAVFYAVNPYMLFTAYERTAYAELLAAAWMPLLLGAILQEEVTITGIALPVALLWLTNAPAAVMGCYALAFLALFRVVAVKRNGDRDQRVSPLLLAARIFSGTALGLALAGFYLVPAVCERRLVQVSMAMIDEMRIDHNFLFEHTGTSSDAVLHDQVLHTVSTIAVFLLCAALVCLAILRYKRHEQSTTDEPAKFPFAAFTGMITGIAFLLTPISNAVWQHAPEARFLQFPWRLLAVLAPACAVLIARCIHSLISTGNGWPLQIGMRPHWTLWGAAAISVAAALVLPEFRTFQQGCDVAETVTARLATFESHTGSNPTDEYTPMTADNDALKPDNPPYWLSTTADGNAAQAGRVSRPGVVPQHFVVQSPAAEFLILNLREYPSWRILLDGRLDATRAQRYDGLIAIPVPAGASTVDVHYATSVEQWAGDAISLVACTLVSLLILRRRGHRTRHPLPVSS